MKVFATRFLEDASSDVVENTEWNWTPENEKAQEVYASGASTSTKQSTYASEKDSQSDTDRPNEGLLVA